MNIRDFYSKTKTYIYFLIGRSFWLLSKTGPTLPIIRDFTALLLLIPLYTYFKKHITNLYNRLSTYALTKMEGIESICYPEFPRRVERFAEEGWEFLNHLISAIWCIMYFSYKDFWFMKFENIWKIDPLNKPLEFQFKLFYLYQMLFYSELTIDTLIKRGFSDMPLLIHHFTTAVLILLSYLNGYADVGVLVLILHDISDLFVALTKMFNYVKLREISEYILFPMLLVCWFIFKLFLFPYYVISSTLTDSIKYPELHGMGAEKWGYGWKWMVLNFFLITLLMLHIFWFYKFCKIFLRLMIKNCKRSRKKKREYIVVGGDGDDEGKKEM